MQKSMKKSIALLSVLFAAFAATAQQKITSPKTAFGFEPGADRKLADWNELTAYFKKLGTESTASVTRKWARRPREDPSLR
jgi:hypothetical protein